MLHWPCHPLNMTTSALTPTLISSVPELEAFLSSIPPSSTLYLDLEGNRLSRHGTISLIAVLIYPQRVVRLIDVFVLGKSAFTTASNNGKTLKSIFEDPDIPKCAWDVRNDADALLTLYHAWWDGPFLGYPIVRVLQRPETAFAWSRILDRSDIVGEITSMTIRPSRLGEKAVEEYQCTSKLSAPFLDPLRHPLLDPPPASNSGSHLTVLSFHRPSRFSKVVPNSSANVVCKQYPYSMLFSVLDRI